MFGQLVVQEGVDGRCLLDVLSELSDGAVRFEGVFAFASRAGIELLLDDEAFSKFLLEGESRIVVGVDAVTSRQALERLQSVQSSHEDCEVRVVDPESASGLFHPKIGCFIYEDGSVKVIAGSGNLTPGGLRNNFEAFVVMELSPSEAEVANPFREFVSSYPGIRRIDDDMLKRASDNVGATGGGKGEGGKGAEEADVVQVATEEAVGDPSERVFIGYVPAGGSRWGQAHLNSDIVEDYFRVELDSHSEFMLQQRLSNGRRGPREERTLVYSSVNKNPKIEIGAAKGLAYPDQDGEERPIVVMRRVTRSLYDYVLLMPSDDGHSAVKGILEKAEAEGRTVGRGLERVIEELATVRSSWDDCPL